MKEALIDTVGHQVVYLTGFWVNDFPVIIGTVAIFIGFIAAVWMIVGGTESSTLKKFGGRKTFYLTLVFYVTTMLLIGQYLTMEIWKETVKWYVVFFVGANVLEYGGRALVARANNKEQE